MKPAPNSEPTGATARTAPEESLPVLTRRHLQYGWWSLLCFLTLGMVLEALHGFKAGMYLDVSNSTRRLMWTLAHAHGTLLSLVHIAFGASLQFLPAWTPRSRGLASACLTSAGFLIPGGFFLGGIADFKRYQGDPGLGIVLVPVGALVLFTGVFLTARAAQSSKTTAGTPENRGKKK
jgi:membrane protein DedA with SNARE-associated domain